MSAKDAASTDLGVGVVLRGLIPSGGGLREADWAVRHRFLTWLLAGTALALTAFGRQHQVLDGAWLVTMALIAPCLVAAMLLPPRRLPSMFVAVGFTVACAGFVAMCNGLTEAHFSFFIAVAALSLYRDWTPFGVFLVGTVVHHAVFGAILSGRTFDHHDAMHHPLEWALLHGAAVLAAAAFQVIAWRLTESEEQRAQESLDESQAHLDMAFDATPVPTAFIDLDGRIVRINHAYRSWLGLPDVLPEGFSVSDLPVTLKSPTSSSLFPQLVEEDGAVTITREFVRDDGSTLYVEMHSSVLRDGAGRPRLVFVQCIDLTEKWQHAAELRRQVREDSLTGLLSRAAFEHDLAELVTTGTPTSVIYVDVDRFKTINDSLGHAAGDDALTKLATRITASTPAGSVVARLGGDEFAVAVPMHLDDGTAIAQRILAAVAEPLPVLGGRLDLTVSIGVSLARGSTTAERAVREADTAMYAAKRAGGGRHSFYNPSMGIQTERRVAAEADLRDALSGNLQESLPVWFQPIVSPTSGRIIGAEALVRMAGPDGRLTQPSDFIQVAEDTGLIVQLGEHVLGTAIDLVAGWQDDLEYVSVNVSPRELSEPDFVPSLARLLAPLGHDQRGRLVLEITETAGLASSAGLRITLDQIKALGVRLALDDFGTGYSSLAWLQSVPADIVKLDRSLVSGVSQDPVKASIISAVMGLGRSLQMSVVAEGVETAEDWQALQDAGCPAVQGFHFSRPITSGALESLLDAERNTAAGELLDRLPSMREQQTSMVDGMVDGMVGG